MVKGKESMALQYGMEWVSMYKRTTDRTPRHTQTCALLLKYNLKSFREAGQLCFRGLRLLSWVDRYTHTHTPHSCVVVPTYTIVLGRYSQSTFRRHNHIHSPQAKSVTVFKSDHYTCNTCISWLTAALIWKGGNRQCMVHTATTVHRKELQATTETSQ